MIYLIHGPDAASARRTAEDAAVRHDPDGANTSRFDAAETPLAQIINAAGSLGFFGPGRVILVRDLMTKAKGRGGSGGDDESDAPASGSLDLAPLFVGTPPENTLILVDPSLATVPAAIKKAAKDASILGCEPPRGRDLIRWAVQAARESSGAIDEDAARELIASLYPQTWQAKPNNPRYDRPPDLDLLRTRVETLVMFAHPEPVTRRHVQALVEGAPDDRIFAFVEAAANGDIGGAARQLEHLLAAGEEPAKLAAQVFSQIELGAIAGSSRGIDPADAGRAIGLSNPNQLVAIARSRRGGPESVLPQVLSALESERNFKTGRLRQPIDEL
ncbi:MAG: DNA polymerase III subunit delta, partial [Thermomicrobiales bacterium]